MAYRFRDRDDDDEDDDDDRPSRRRRSRYDDDDDEDEDEDDEYDRRRSRRRGVCPYCDSDEEPVRRTKMSQNGLITLIVLIVLFWPLCWIGLLMKEEYRVCYDCGADLDR